MAKNLTKAQQKQLALKQQEQALNQQLLADAAEFINLGGELTALQQEHIKNLQIEQALRGEAANLEAELTKQAQSGNDERSKQGELGKGMLDSLKESLQGGDITVDQFREQVSLVGQVAKGQMDAAAIQQTMADNAGNLTAEMEQYLSTQEQAQDNSSKMGEAMSAADEATGGMGSTIANFVMNPLTAILTLLTAFSAATDEIGGKFGAIGVTQFRGELGAARKEFIGMGFDGAEALDVVESLSTEFGIGFSKAMDMATTVGDIARSTGLANSEASTLVGLLTATQGLSADEAENLAKGTYELAAANDVAPTQVLKDIAGSAETFALFGQQGAEGLMRAAVQARKLGTNMDAISKSAESALDFQSSLQAEISASAILGRRVNMQKARELAMMGDMEGYAIELAKQAGTAEEFAAMNMYQRKALARALGVEVTELSKIVNKEKEAATLAGEISKMDASNILPEDSMSAIAETISNLKAMGLELVEEYGPQIEELFASLGEILMPIAEGAIQWLASFAEGENVLGNLKGILIGVASVMGLIAISSIIQAVAGIVSSFSKIPFGVGVVLGIGAAAAFLTMVGGIASMFGMLETGTELGGIKKDNSIAALHAGETVLNAKDTAMLATSLSAVRGGSRGSVSAQIQQNENRQIKIELSELRKDMASYFGLGGNVSRQIVSGFGEKFRESKKK